MLPYRAAAVLAVNVKVPSTYTYASRGEQWASDFSLFAGHGRSCKQGKRAEAIVRPEECFETCVVGYGRLKLGP